jgi:polycystin 1L2
VLLVQIFRNLRPKKTKVEPENSEVHNNVENKIKEDKPQVRRGKLPHWFIYPAYALCYLASAASIFFTLLYSIQWGKETSTEWVIAMVTSFFQSVLLLQPVKVVVVAVVFALIIKKPSDTEEGLDDVPLVERKVKKDGAPKKMKKYYRYCKIKNQTKTSK